MLLVVGVPWMLLGVFGRLLARGGNYTRYVRCMWLGFVLGVLWLLVAAVVMAAR